MDKKQQDKIIKIAMKRIGTKRISTLDGLTICIDDVFYNIYVNDNEVEIVEV